MGNAEMNTRRRRRRLRPLVRALALAVAPALVAGVAGCNSRDELPGYDLRMYKQPKHNPYDGSAFFADGQSARPLVPGTVAREEVYHDRQSEPGWRAAAPGDGFPADFPAGGDLRAALRRGQQRYEAFCSMCHGLGGHGDGMIVQRGFTPPPAFVLIPADRDRNPYRYQREEFLQTAPPRHVYDVITNGWGAMYSYGDRIRPEDRWAIVAYVKLLQQAKVEPAAAMPPGTAEPPGQSLKHQP